MKRQPPRSTRLLPKWARRTRLLPERRLFALTLAASLGLLSLSPGLARAAPSWYLEVPPEGVNESVARRTLALELQEFELPPDPRCADDVSSAVSLHVKITRADDAFVVEVWDRGESAGRRTISAQGHPSTVGRRAALAAAELARQLAGRRARLRRELAREEELQQKVKLAAAREEAERGVAASGTLSGLWLPEGGWALGPLVGAEFNGQLPLRFRLELGWMAGELPVLAGAPLGGGAPGWSLVDLRTSAFWLWEPKAAVGLEVGTLVAVSAVHTQGTTEVDGIAAERDTWTARLGLALGGTYDLDDHVRLRLGLEAGVMLRRIPLASGSMEAQLGGGFVGLGFGAVIRP